MKGMKDGQREAKSGRRKGRGAGRAGAGNAAERRSPRGCRQRREAVSSTEGTRGPDPGSEQSPIPPPTPTRTCSRVPFPSPPRWARPRLPGLESPSASALAILTSGSEAARPGRRARPDPTGSAAGPSQGAGPPLAGHGAGRRGGCHASRALGNLGLKATPSGGGGGGSSRALRPPARGGVCRRSPPPPLPSLSCRWPAPHPPASAANPTATHGSHLAAALAPSSAASLSPGPPNPPLPPNLSEPRFLH